MSDTLRSTVSCDVQGSEGYAGERLFKHTLDTALTASVSLWQETVPIIAATTDRTRPSFAVKGIAWKSTVPILVQLTNGAGKLWVSCDCSAAVAADKYAMQHYTVLNDSLAVADYTTVQILRGTAVNGSVELTMWG